MEGYPIILGNYEIIKPLAEGGFGQVYLARMGGAAGFSRTVAVKRIRPEYTSSPAFVSDFIKEARIGGLLTHHNVVQVLGFEEIQGQYFLIMEYVDGVGLDYVIRFTRKRGETLPLSVVAEIIAQAAEGLHYVHALKDAGGASLKLVHRDLKPSNLMISRIGLVKVTDFGVARAAIEVGMKTQAGLIKGTLAYLSPEQARDEELDHRSDLYSLGAILYELLALKRLFPNESVFTTIEALGHNAVEEPLEKLPADASIFLPLLKDLLTERPEDRIPNGSEVARRVRELQLQLTTAKVSLAPFAEQWIESRQAELTLRRLRKHGHGAGAGSAVASQEGAPPLEERSPASSPVPEEGARASSPAEMRTVRLDQHRPERHDPSPGAIAPDPPQEGTPTELARLSDELELVSVELAQAAEEPVASPSYRETAPAQQAQKGRFRRRPVVLAGAVLFLAVALAAGLVIRRSGDGRQAALLDAVHTPGTGPGSVLMSPRPVASLVPGAEERAPAPAGEGEEAAPTPATDARAREPSTHAVRQKPAARPGAPRVRAGARKGEAGSGEGVEGKQRGPGDDTGGHAAEDTGWLSEVKGSGATLPGDAGVVASIPVSVPDASRSTVTGAGQAASPPGGEATDKAGAPGGTDQEEKATVASPRTGTREHSAEPTGSTATPDKGSTPVRRNSPSSPGAGDAGEPAVAAVPAPEPPGRITVTSRPSAIVYLDGKTLGETPLRSRATAPGTYTLRLSRPDLEFRQETRVTIEPGKDVKVICTSSGCDVYAP